MWKWAKPDLSDLVLHGPPVPPHQPMWGFLKTYFFWHFYMSKIRIRMLDDNNLPPEIDISTQRWHVLMRQNHDLSHNNSSHMPICSTLMDNISHKNNYFNNIKWHGMLVLNVLTCHYIPRSECTLGGYYGFVIVTSLRKHFIKRTKILIGVLPHVTCIFI